MTAIGRLPVLRRTAPSGTPIQIGVARVQGAARLFIHSDGYEVFTDQVHQLVPPIRSAERLYTHLCPAAGGVILLTQEDTGQLLQACRQLEGQAAPLELIA